MSRRFPAPALPKRGGEVLLDPEASHHLLRVNRTPRGASVLLFDGAGREALAILIDVQGDRALLRVEEDPRPRRAEQPTILLQALLKRPAWETALRMSVELGVTELRPFIGARSVRRPMRDDRWRRILVSAAGQCGRGDLPHLAPAPSLEVALAGLPEVTRLVLTPGAERTQRPMDGVALLLGPEGGLAPEELQLASSYGFAPAGLGPWTLRADTAAVAALTLYTSAGA